MFWGGNFERKEGAGVGWLGWAVGWMDGMWIDELGGAAGKGKGKGSSPVQQASRWSKIAKEQKKIEKKSKMEGE